MPKETILQLQGNRLVSLDRALIGTLAVGSLALVGIMSFQNSEAWSSVAVVFPPGTSRAEAATRAANAGASLLQVGRYPFIVVVRPSSEKYWSRVRRQGALFIIAVGKAGCAAPIKRPS